MVCLNIDVPSASITFSVVSVSEPRRWKKQNNNEFYRQLLNVHEWGHSRAWMGLCFQLLQGEASLKIQANSPMRSGEKTCHGDIEGWSKYELEKQNPWEIKNWYWHYSQRQKKPIEDRKTSPQLFSPKLVYLELEPRVAQGKFTTTGGLDLHSALISLL